MYDPIRPQRVDTVNTSTIASPFSYHPLAEAAKVSRKFIVDPGGGHERAEFAALNVFVREPSVATA